MKFAAILSFQLGLAWAPGFACAQPIRAADFLDSIGICTHVVQGIDSPQQVIPALRYAGIRHVREDGTHNSIIRAKLVGIHFATQVTFDELAISDSDSASIADSVVQYKQLAKAGALFAVEGPNEPNNFPIQYQGIRSNVGTTFGPVAKFQRDLYATVKADPSLAKYKVFASSESGGPEPDNQGLQYLRIPAGAHTLMPANTSFADFANLHNYLKGNGMTAPIDNTAWGAEANAGPEGSWDGLFGEYGVTWSKRFPGYSVDQLPRVPKVTTETGWPTAGDNSITEEQQGKLLTNLFFSAAARGWSYTFIYMLADEPQANNGYYGIFHQDYSPKLAAVYLHNLTRILADQSRDFVPASFDYSIINRSRTVHDLLLQKHNGKYNLAIWNEQINGSTTVTVKLNRPVAVLKLYDVTRSTLPIREYRNVSSLLLTLTDHALILEFP